VARQATIVARMADRIRVWERWLAPLLDAIPPVVPRWNLHAALLKALPERSERQPAETYLDSRWRRGEGRAAVAIRASARR
jgi:hypothetical protein